jgi:hypothetical protein
MHGRIWYWSSSPYPGKCPRPRPYSKKYAQAGLITCQFRGRTTDSLTAVYSPSRVSRFHMDVCLRITTHLDDKDNLRVSIRDLVRLINTTQDGEVGTVYGIACSIFHCAVVRVDKDLEGTSFAHTPALQFLPSFFARKFSTPGIEAMSRLGCQATRVEFLTAISDAYNLPRITHEESLVASSMTSKVPVEVWTRIGDFITSPADFGQSCLYISTGVVSCG